MSHGSKICQICPKLGASGLYLQFEITDGYKMMNKGWSSIEEVPYCFSRSWIKFQGRTSLKIVEFDPNWAFPDCNYNLSSPMATKWRIKLKYHRRGALLFSAATKQLYDWFRPSVCPSVCLSHLFHHVPIIVSWNFQELLPWSKVMEMQKVKVRGQRSRSQRSTPN